MNSHKYMGTVCVAVMSATLITASVSAKSFKAKLYPECYAQVSDVEALVTPKESMSKKANKLGGLFGSVASVAGLGGAGASVYKAANTVNKIQKYSGIIDNVSGFTAQMVEDHPDTDDRFAAYGNHMNTDAQNVQKVEQAIVAAQSCYDTAYDTLAQKIATKELKASKAKKPLKEIQKGSKAVGDVLVFALQHVQKNIGTYDQVLGAETQTFTPSLHSLFAAQQTGVNAAVAQRAYERATSIDGVTGVGTAASMAKLRNASGGGLLGASTLSGLAGMLSSGAGQAGDQQQGVQAIAASSQHYLALSESLNGVVDVQRALETKVNKGF